MYISSYASTDVTCTGAVTGYYCGGYADQVCVPSSSGVSSTKLDCAAGQLLTYLSKDCTGTGIPFLLNTCFTSYKYTCSSAPAVLIKSYNTTTNPTCTGNPLFSTYQPQDVCQFFASSGSSSAFGTKYKQVSPTSWNIEMYGTKDCTGAVLATQAAPAACTAGAGGYSTTVQSSTMSQIVSGVVVMVMVMTSMFVMV